MRVASRRVMLNAQVGNKNRGYEHGKNEVQRESLEIKRGGGMRKVEMARRIAEATGLSQVKSEEAIDAVLEEIKSTLQQGDSVILRRFGSFQVRVKRAESAAIPKRVKRRIFQLVVWCGLNLGMSLRMPCGGRLTSPLRPNLRFKIAHCVTSMAEIVLVAEISGILIPFRVTGRKQLALSKRKEVFPWLTSCTFPCRTMTK